MKRVSCSTQPLMQNIKMKIFSKKINQGKKYKRKCIFNVTRYTLHVTRKGQAALSLVFLIGGIALLVSVTLAVIAISFLNSTFAFQSANRAYANATSGAQDALLKLARNDAFSDTVGYAVPKGCSANCATVVVTQVTPGIQVEIVSTATVFASTRKIKVVAAIDPNNGEVTVSSWSGLEL